MQRNVECEGTGPGFSGIGISFVTSQISLPYETLDDVIWCKALHMRISAPPSFAARARTIACERVLAMKSAMSPWIILRVL